MPNFTIHSDKNELLIQIGKDDIAWEVLLKIAHRLRVEYLAQKAGFTGDFSDLIEEIDENWWNKNGDDFLKNVAR